MRWRRTIQRFCGKGLVGSLGGQLDSLREILTLRKREVDIPLKLNHTGRYATSVVVFGERHSQSAKGPTFPASFFEWAFAKKRPNLSDGGLHLPYSKDGLYRLEPPHNC